MKTKQKRTATNYYNATVVFEIDQRVKYIDANGHIFAAIIVNFQGEMLDLDFEEGSQSLESPKNCYH